MTIYVAWWMAPAALSAAWVYGCIKHSRDEFAYFGALASSVPVLLAWVIYLAIRVMLGVV